jgi:uncharacterized protein (DUF2062 family)
MSFTPDTETAPSGSGSGMLSAARRALGDLATVESSPRRTAAALALGVFLSFSPLLGLQILLGLGVAFLFRLSRVAVLIGLCANVPWIMLPWYAVTTGGAAAVLGISADVDIGARLARMFDAPVYQSAFWGHARDLIGAFFWPFLMGPTAGALALAVTTYAVSLRILTRRGHERGCSR